MIDCNTYDYIEIACLYKMQVKLTFLEGSSVEGSANTTVINNQRQECIELLTTSEECILVPLEQTSYMTALDKNPYFKGVDFRCNQVDKY